MIQKKLPRSFYLRPTLTVAKDLLGKFIFRRHGKNYLIGKIVEVEAYLGEQDAASHAFNGRTDRNEVMFREGGSLYVYFTYGMHFCANVVTEQESLARAVLIRGVEPVEGIVAMRKNRGYNNIDRGNINLTNGPAKFCEAFNIKRGENGADLLNDKIFLTAGDAIAKSKITATTRIGITDGKEKKWRFYIKENKFVSRP